MPLLLTWLLLACSNNPPAETQPEPEPEVSQLERVIVGCKEGAAEACVGLGLYYAPDGEEPDPEKSRTYLTRACDLDHGPACASAGARVLERMPSDAKAARALFEKGCVLDDATSCFNFGRALADEADPEPMEAAYTKACDASQAQACANLAVHLHEGPRKHPERAHAAADRACGLGIGLACAIQATYYRTGEVVAVDAERATSLETQACTLGHQESCSPDHLQ